MSAKKGFRFYRVFIDIEEDEITNIISKVSCIINKFIITSIQKRKYESEARVYYAEEFSLGGKNVEVIPRGSKRISEWNIAKDKGFSATEVGALKKALKFMIPYEIKLSKRYQENDPEYYQQNIDAYNGRIKNTLKRMIKNRENKKKK